MSIHGNNTRTLLLRVVTYEACHSCLSQFFPPIVWSFFIAAALPLDVPPVRPFFFAHPIIERTGLCRGRYVGIPEPHHGLLAEGQARRHHALDGGGGERAGKQDLRAHVALPFPPPPSPTLPYPPLLAYPGMAETTRFCTQVYTLLP